MIEIKEMDFAVTSLAIDGEDARKVRVGLRCDGAGIAWLVERYVTLAIEPWRAKDIKLGDKYRLTFGPILPLEAKG